MSEAASLKRKNEELRILNQIAQTLNHEVELSKALDSALAQCVELLGLKTGWIWLTRSLEETQAQAGLDQTYVAAAYNLPPIFLDHPALLNGTCYCIETYLSGDLSSVTNISEITCTRLKELKHQESAGLRYHATVPLNGRKGSLGLLNLVSTDSQKITQSDRDLLHTIGDMIGIAIERARLYKNSVEFGQTQERNRLAREIHDTLAQGLVALTLKLETAEALLETGKTDSLGPYLSDALTLTRENLEAARRSVLDLRATPLEGRSLLEALVQLAQAASLEVDISETGTVQSLPLSTQMGIFRIVEEAIRNAEKHAGPAVVTVELNYAEDALQLEVRDTGNGFDPEQPTTGFGLIGMNERAKLLKGSFSLHSSAGSGTVLHLHIPLAPKP